jgi:hypothetical protein
VFGEAEPHWLEQEGGIIPVEGDSLTGKIAFIPQADCSRIRD